MDKTIKEFADELGVTKQAIRYQVAKLYDKNLSKNEKGLSVLKPDQQRALNKIMTKNKDKLLSIENKNFSEELSVSQYRQIKSLKEQNLDLRRLLDQQQKLHLKTQQLLEEKTKLIESNESQVNKKIKLIEGYEKLLDNQNIKYADEKNVMAHKATRLLYLAICLGVISFIAIVLCFVLWLS